MPRVLGGSQGSGRFLMSEVPLQIRQILSVSGAPTRGEHRPFPQASVQGYLAHKNPPPPVDPMGVGVSYERGTPVGFLQGPR